MKASTEKNYMVLLPFNTPNPALFDEYASQVFHPACLPYKGLRGKGPHKLLTDFTGHSSITMGLRFGEVIVTIGEENTPANEALERAVRLYTDPENPFADIDVLRTPSKDILGQVQAAFANNSNYQRLIVIWPYQVFNMAAEDIIVGTGDATFSYTHENLKVNRDSIPECIGICATADAKETECEAQAAQSIGTLDEMLVGSYRRILSMVEVDRDEFENWFIDNASEEIRFADFLAKSLKGKRGVLMNPSHSSFIS